MRRNYFLRQLSLALLLFIAVNVALHRGSGNAPARAVLRQMDAQTDTDAVFLGSSLMQAGFDARAFLSENSPNVRAPLNLGLGSTHAVEHLLLLRQAVKKQPRLELVVLGFFDFELMRPPQLPIDGNRMMSYYVEPETAAALYYPDAPLDRALVPVLGKIPVWTERYSLWARVERLRRTLSGVAFARPGSGGEFNPFGRAADFNALEARSVEDFRANCVKYLSQDFSAPVQETLKTAHAHARRVVVVVMPMSPHHRQTYFTAPEWPPYRDHLRQLAAKHGAAFVDAEDWVPSGDGFADNVHLNAKGAEAFSRRLARELATGADAVSPPALGSGD